MELQNIPAKVIKVNTVLIINITKLLKSTSGTFEIRHSSTV